MTNFKERKLKEDTMIFLDSLISIIGCEPDGHQLNIDTTDELIEKLREPLEQFLSTTIDEAEKEFSKELEYKEYLVRYQWKGFKSNGEIETETVVANSADEAVRKVFQFIYDDSYKLVDVKKL